MLMNEMQTQEIIAAGQVWHLVYSGPTTLVDNVLVTHVATGWRCYVSDLGELLTILGEER